MRGCRPTSLALFANAYTKVDSLQAQCRYIRQVVADVASAIARSSIALPELNSPARSTLRLAAAEIPKFEIPSSLLAGAHAIELARMNDAVTGAMGSIAFDNLAASDRSLGRRLVSLSDSYRDIFAGLPKIDFPLPDFVTELPARDMIVKSTIVSSRTVDFEPADATIDLETACVIDPANTANVISDDLTAAEKKKIAQAAGKSLEEPYWEQVLW